MQNTTQQSYPGSRDPKCRNFSSQVPTPTDNLVTTGPPITKQSYFQTTAVKEICYPGSPNTKCYQTAISLSSVAPTYLPPISSTATPPCFPGSKHSSCLQIQTTSKPNCYPTSTDSRCQQTNQSTRCPDPRCSHTTKPPAAYLPPVTTVGPPCYPNSRDLNCCHVQTQNQIVPQTQLTHGVYRRHKHHVVIRDLLTHSAYKQQNHQLHILHQ